MLIGAAGNVFQPFGIVQVPVNCLGKALFEGDGGGPAQFFIDFRGINSVAAVMSGTVFYIGNQYFACTGCITQFFIHLLTEQFDEVDIPPFVKSANIIGLTVLAVMKHLVNGRGMVFYKEPVTGI